MCTTWWYTQLRNMLQGRRVWLKRACWFASVGVVSAVLRVAEGRCHGRMSWMLLGAVAGWVSRCSSVSIVCMGRICRGLKPVVRVRRMHTIAYMYVVCTRWDWLYVRGMHTIGGVGRPGKGGSPSARTLRAHDRVHVRCVHTMGLALRTWYAHDRRRGTAGRGRHMEPMLCGSACVDRSVPFTDVVLRCRSRATSPSIARGRERGKLTQCGSHAKGRHDA